MAASDVEVCNGALTILGASTIITLEDEDPKATVLKLRYGPVRDAELRRHRWRFSLTRASLAADVTAPLYGFARQFPLPADCLRVVQIGAYHIGPNLSDYQTADGAAYSLEGRQILSDLAAPLSIRYIRRVTDPGLFDSSFSEAFAARLAYECCERITASTSKRVEAREAYMMALREAITANALESPPNTRLDDTWIMARLG
jgi:hypothetical protein